MREPDTAGDTQNSRQPATKREGSRYYSRRQALVSLTSVGTLALAGCNFQSVMPGVKPLWERDFSSAMAAGPPAATDEHVVVGGQDTQLHAFSADGERTFRFETGGPIEARPAVPASGGPVHVHSTDGDLYTVGLSGAKLWHVEGQAQNRWLDRQGPLLFGTAPDGRGVTGYDARDGTRRFQLSGQADPYPPSPFSRSPTLSGSVCLLSAPNSDGDEKLVAHAPRSGEVLWESKARDRSPSVVAADEWVLTAYWRSDSYSTVCMRRASNGHIRWQTAVAGDVSSHFGSPLWLGEHVYVQSSRDERPDELVAIDRADGSIQWRRSVGYELERVTPTAAGVFVASSVVDPDGGILVRLDAFSLDGTQRWQTTTDVHIGGTVQSLGRVGGVLFVASDNEIAAYDPDSGSRRWQYNPESSQIGVSAADGALYISHRDTGGLARLPTD